MAWLEDIEKSATRINWEEFHFLRPDAFYFFIPLLLILVLLMVGNKSNTKWKKLIAPHLRDYMFSKGNWWAMALPLISFFLATTIGILAIAGPTWSKEKIPGQRVHAVTLVALDLSSSMLAKDIDPSRLERAKLKIDDFLDAQPGARVGLLAYAGTPHLVLPFTSDYNIIRHHTASLLSRAMPVKGTDYNLLIGKIDTLMRRIDAPSTVLLLTDEIDSNAATILADWVNNSPHHIELILFSTINGAIIPGHSDVHSKQDQSVLKNLAANERIIVTPLTLDQSDVTSIAERIRKKLVFQKDEGKKEDVWEDRGWLLIYPALLIALLWFRKGWVIQWCWMLPFVLTSCGLNSKHPDWWYSKNYQGQLLDDANLFDSAAERFESETHKAVAYYKAGNYEAAADLFAQDTTAAGLYNQGLALVKLGRYDEAIQAFDSAGAIDPALKSKVDESRLKTHVMKHRADSVMKFDHAKIGSMRRLNNNHKKNDPLKERKPGSKDEELSADTQVKNLPKFGNRVTDETQSDIHSAKEAKTPPKDFKLEKAKSETEIILRRSVSDPGEFLHRRFELQKKRDYPTVKNAKEPW